MVEATITGQDQDHGQGNGNPGEAGHGDIHNTLTETQLKALVLWPDVSPIPFC